MFLVLTISLLLQNDPLHYRIVAFMFGFRWDGDFVAFLGPLVILAKGGRAFPSDIALIRLVHDKEQNMKVCIPAVSHNGRYRPYCIDHEFAWIYQI